MKTISAILEYNGVWIKVYEGKVYLRAFGTTIQSCSMHWSWMEIDQNNLKDGLRNKLNEKGLL